MSNVLNKTWQELYSLVKDPRWPDVATQEDFIELPNNILQEILFEHMIIDQEKFDLIKEKNEFIKLSELYKNYDYLEFGNFLNDNTDLEIDRVWQTKDIMVFFNESLEGGGLFFGNEYLHVLDKVYPSRQFENCLEWCSGPGFIGFMLLANRVCRNLTLGEIYKPCIKALETTISHLDTKYKGSVQYAQMSSLTDLPKIKFDLIVGNPPHWNPNSGQMYTKYNRNDRVCADLDWKIHKDFYSNVKKYLSKDGVLLLMENALASGPSTFESMIDSNDLKIVDCYVKNKQSEMYFIEVTHK